MTEAPRSHGYAVDELASAAADPFGITRESWASPLTAVDATAAARIGKRMVAPSSNGDGERGRPAALAAGQAGTDRGKRRMLRLGEQPPTGAAPSSASLREDHIPTMPAAASDATAPSAFAAGSSTSAWA